MAADDSPFLSRWSQRKARVREGLAPDPLPATHAVPSPTTTTATTPTPKSNPQAQATGPTGPIVNNATAADEAAPATEPPALTLDDVAALTRESDYSAFVARGVGPEVRNAALKKLFTDPHFNVMDGLDTYIADYGQPDPLPQSMLRKMVQSQFLGLFADEAGADPAAPTTLPPVAAATPSATPSAEPTALPTPTDEDADLQLQPDHAPGRPGAEPGAGEDSGCQH